MARVINGISFDDESKAKSYESFLASQERSKKYAEIARVRQTILAKKAKEAGIAVTPKEIDDYIANMKK